jgi:protein-disulfide isomerase
MIENLTVCVSARDHVRGPLKARVTLVEYGDFACAHCARAFPVVQELLLQYRTTLRFVFRHNPLGDLNDGARLAAHAAEAAGKQGRFWAMHDLLFERRGPISRQRLEAYAALLELDVQRFRDDIDSAEIARRVRDDEIGALRSGVVGTPTFFINGRHFRDKPDLETLFTAIGFGLLSATAGKSRLASAKPI